MKSIIEYARERQQQITQLNEMSSINGDLILESTFFSKLAEFLGGKAREIKKRWEEYKNDFKQFPDNVAKAFNGFMANANNEKDKLEADKRQDIIDKVTAKDVEDIPKTVIELINSNKDNDNFKNSATTAYLTALAINIAKAKGNKEALTELEQFFKEISNNVKKEASDNFKNAVNDNKPDNTETTPDNTEKTDTEGKQNNSADESDKTEDDQTKDDQTKEVVDNVVNSEDIKQAAADANIKISKLTDEMMMLLNDKNIDNDIDVDELEDLCKAIAEVICGIKTLENNEKINKNILDKYHIDNIEEFMKLIMDMTKE